MSNIFSGIVGAVIGGGIVAAAMSLREKWQDELIDSARFEDIDGPATPSIQVDEDQPNEEAANKEDGRKEEESASPSSNLKFTDEDRERQRVAVERMVAESEARKELRAQIKAEREERKAREERGDVETPDEAPSSATYDPYTGIYKDGDFEVEVAVPVEVSGDIPTEFDFDQVSHLDELDEDREFYVRCFNHLVDTDQVIPFDRNWLDADGNLTGLSAVDHRRHEKGFFGAVTEDEQETAVLHISRRGVTALRMRDGSIEWATSRLDHPVTHMDQMGAKEREKFRHDWAIFNGD